MKKIKYTEDYIKQICDDKNLIFIDIDKINYNGKERRVLSFVCKDHENKGVQLRPIEKIIKNKKHCQYCNHTKLKETFIDEMKIINPDIEILSDYVNWNTKIKCKCKIDGYKWDGNVSTLLYGSGCKLCGYKKIWKGRKKTTNDFIDEMKKVNKNIKIIGDYSGSHNLIRCKCLIDNYEWESYASNLLNKSAGCPECAKNNIKKIESLSDNEFKERLKQVNENVILLDKYVNTNTKLNFKCLIHNHIFVTSPRNFLYKGGKGCPYCNQSMGEKKMISILENKGFSILKQHTFSDCVYIGKLRFDAYDINNNITYEYQGQQHYYPVDFAGKGEEWAINQYNIGQSRDEIKRKFCKENNITLIEVPYWEYDNMKDFLENKIKNVI